MRVCLENAYSCPEGQSLVGVTVFLGHVALKLVVMTLVCVKLVTNLWRFVPPEKGYCKK